MKPHTKVAQLYDEVRVDDEFTVGVGRDSALVSPLLRLVINSEKINGFVRFPSGTAEYNWLIRRVIVLVSPDFGRVEERLALQVVVTVHPAGDQDLFVARKCNGALAAAREYAAVRN